MALGVLSKHDPKDPTSVNEDIRRRISELDRAYSIRENSNILDGLTVGIPRVGEAFHLGLYVIFTH